MKIDVRWVCPNGPDKYAEVKVTVGNSTTELGVLDRDERRDLANRLALAVSDLLDN